MQGDLRNNHKPGKRCISAFYGHLVKYGLGSYSTCNTSLFPMCSCGTSPLLARFSWLTEHPSAAVEGDLFGVSRGAGVVLWGHHCAVAAMALHSVCKKEESLASANLYSRHKYT